MNRNEISYLGGYYTRNIENSNTLAWFEGKALKKLVVIRGLSSAFRDYSRMSDAGEITLYSYLSPLTELFVVVQVKSG